MKVTYTGKNAEFTPQQQNKLEQKFQKLSKLLDRRSSERDVRVILTTERHLTHAEITVPYYDHQIVGVGSDPEVASAVADAIDKLEKQILKQQTKWRDTKRTGPRDEWPESEAAEGDDEEATQRAHVHGAVESADGGARHVFRVDRHARRKPMTIDEALLEIQDRTYVVYRDAQSDHVCVLVRRNDGNFDLIEA
jgi:putative sigma-54 modulation protein